MLQLFFFLISLRLKLIELIPYLGDLISRIVGQQRYISVLSAIQLEHILSVAIDVAQHLLLLFQPLLRKDKVDVQYLVFVVLQDVHFVVEFAVGVLIEASSQQDIETNLDTP